MNIFDLLGFVGGLALFLYGMHLLGTGLEKVSGGRLEKILGRMTGSPLRGVLLGAAVTAVIQSSSATTVMVVGFVNSGIMSLTRAIGVIMGANIGTTVTLWILSLTGVEGDNFFIKMLNPSSFSPVLAVVGVIFMLFSKNSRKKDIGSILVGFAVLMFGMNGMSAAVKPLADVPEFQSVLTLFKNPVLGVLVGAAFTAVIQSSSASVGILQALSATGGLTFGAAVPIILGQNIGTCATELLSCIGASKNAKRAAVVHLYFNVIGTALFLALFYGLGAFIDLGLSGKSVDAFGIAATHTVFNLLSTAVLLPFYKLLGRLAELTVKEKDESRELPYLDERFLGTPAFAVEQSKNTAAEMAELARDMLMRSVALLSDYSAKAAQGIAESEDLIDRYEDKLGTYLVKLSSRGTTERDSRVISALLHVIGDLERIGDHGMNLSELALEIYEKEIKFSLEGEAELAVMTAAVTEILSLAVRSFEEDDVALARRVEPLEQVIDELQAELKRRHIGRVRKGQCTLELGFVYNDIIGNYERVADHCSNIALSVIQLEERSEGAHGYVNFLKETDEPQYRREIARYAEVYRLNPEN